MDVNFEVILDIPPHRQEIVIRDQVPDFVRVMKQLRLDNDGDRFATVAVTGKSLN